MQGSLRFFTFFRKERKRTQRSFGFHKSPKTRKKERKRTWRSLKEHKRTICSERKRMWCPTLEKRERAKSERAKSKRVKSESAKSKRAKEQRAQEQRVKEPLPNPDLMCVPTVCTM